MKQLEKNKEYIEISSDGEIEEDAFLIMGGSTKQDKKDKIGRFGSGLKYSIATLLSKGNDFEVWSGKDPIEFKLNKKEFRGEMFDMISINGNDTNFSTQMGPDWTYYDALRDIYANAVDENLLSFCSTDDIRPEDDQTKFYIEITEEVEEFIDNIEKYFSIFRNDEILEHNGAKIYKSAGHLIVYKSGFKVYEDESKEALFNYDFPNISINESRELKSYYNMVWKVRDLILKHPNKKVADIFIDHSEDIDEDGKSPMWEFSIDWDTYGSVSDDWEEYFEGKTLLPAEASSFYSGHSSIGVSTGLSRVPSSFVGSVSKNLNVNTVGQESDKCPYMYKESQMNSGDYEMMLILKAILIHVDMDMQDIQIKKVSFNEGNIRSSYDKKYGKKIILLSEDAFKDIDTLKAEFIKQVPAMNTDVSIGSARHLDVLSKFVADKFLTKSNHKIKHK